MHLTTLLSLSIFTLVLASPFKQPELEERDVCRAVDFVVALLKLNKAAPFCSSYLHIQPTTSTSTTQSTSTSTTVISSQLATVTVTAPTTTVTSITGLTTATCSALNNNQRRGNSVKSATPAIPAFLANVAKAAISTACSCLAGSAPTVTAIATKVITVVVTSEVPYTGTITTTPSTTVSTGSTTTITPLINLPYGSGAGLCSDEDGWYYYEETLGKYWAHNCHCGGFGPGYFASNFQSNWTFVDCVDACVDAQNTRCAGVNFAPSSFCLIETQLTSGGCFPDRMVGYTTTAPPCVSAAASMLPVPAPVSTQTITAGTTVTP